MRPHVPGKKSFTAIAVLAACLAAFATAEANAQAASSFNLSGNLSGMSLSPLLFDHSAPPPLTPQPGGAFTEPAATMPVPPLSRTTLPSIGGTDAPQTQAAAEHDDGDSHAALDDKALDGVR